MVLTRTTAVKVSQGVDGGNPVCEPVYVNGAEPGDTLQVDVLQLRTAEFGWTCVRPSGTTLEAPTREVMGDDPQYDDPAGPVRPNPPSHVGAPGWIAHHPRCALPGRRRRRRPRLHLAAAVDKRHHVPSH